MGCCGQKRAALASAPPEAVTPPPQTITRTLPNLPAATAAAQVPVQKQLAQPLPSQSSVAIRYTETSPILVLGPASGRRYQFSRAKPVQIVEARDAAALLRTRFFTQSRSTT